MSRTTISTFQLFELFPDEEAAPCNGGKDEKTEVLPAWSPLDSTERGLP